MTTTVFAAIHTGILSKIVFCCPVALLVKCTHKNMPTEEPSELESSVVCDAMATVKDINQICEDGGSESVFLLVLEVRQKQSRSSENYLKSFLSIND